MAFSRPPVTAANAAFGPLGAAAWAAGFGVSGATSGGIPYFSSATSEASSALLAAADPVLGGGAGTAPYTDSGLTGSGTGASFILSPSALGFPSGTTTTAPTLGFYLDAYANTNVTFQALTPSCTFGQGFIRLVGNGYFVWGSQVNTFSSSVDGVTLSRLNATTLRVGTGGSQNASGRIAFTSSIAGAVAVAALNAAPTVGEIQSVNDSLAPVAGAAVAAGGAANALVWWNGAQWTVIGV